MRPRLATVLFALMLATSTLAMIALPAGAADPPPECGNPYLAILPDYCDPDFEYWNAVMEEGARERAERMGGPSPRLIGYTELEPAGFSGVNDVQGTAEFIAGFGTGAGDDPEADVSGDMNADLDFFSFALEEGDVIGANVTGNASTLRIFSPGGALLMGSSGDGSFLYPAASGLPGGGNAVLDWVVDADGTYAIEVSGGTGAYTLQLRVFRPVLESRDNAHQVLFVDFDGATIPDRSIFGGPASPGTLDPLADFLANWGLAPGDEDAVIDAIMATVEENFQDVRDLGANGDRDTSGIPGEFKVEILNSRDHADPWGAPNVSRVIVGGTIAQLGVSTIGIAEVIDPGNFDPETTAVVLLDLRSAAPPDCNSLNVVTLDPSATIIDLIGISIGNTVAHEAGHYWGNWHVDNAPATFVDVMDRGGTCVDVKPALGPDMIFGNADDIDRDFGADVFSPAEGFTGTENTMNKVSFGLSTGPMACAGATATIIGTGGNDVLTGTGGPDVIVGLGGADTIDGLGGNDIICGGDQSDTLLGGPGHDQLLGEGASDRLFGDDGNDHLSGGDGADELNGGSGNDNLVGGGGLDTLRGGDGEDELRGNDSADYLHGGADDDMLYGGLGSDDMRGGSGDDRLNGAGGADTLVGGPGTDVLHGGSGPDTCSSGETLFSC